MSAPDRVRPHADEVAAKVMDGEAILINLADGMYYSMDLAGGYVWTLIEKEASLDDIAASVSAHYDVDTAVARQDIERLVTQLLAAGLVVEASVADAAPVTPPAPVERRQAYQPPALNAYDDMAELLALDPPHPGMANTLSKPVTRD